MPTRLLLATAAALSAMSCQGEAPRVADPVVLALGDQEVRRSDFERYLKGLEQRGEGPFAPTVRSALFEQFLRERVVVLEARARGLVATPAAPEEEARAVRRLLEPAIPKVDVTDGEVESYYREHREEFRLPDKVTLRQILVGTENEARDALRRLQKEPSSFETLARTRSRAPEAVKGGLMGTFSRGELPPELETAAFGLAKGAVGYVASPLGHHVLKVEERHPARDVPLDECRGHIVETLSRDKTDLAVRRFVQGLLARAKVNHEAVQVLAAAS